MKSGYVVIITLLLSSACVKRRYTIDETPQSATQSAVNEASLNSTEALPEGDKELPLPIVNPAGMTWTEISSEDAPLDAAVAASSEFQMESGLTLAEGKKALKKKPTKLVNICYRVRKAEFQDYILLGASNERAPSGKSKLYKLKPIPDDTCLSSQLQGWFTAIAMKKSDWQGLQERPNGTWLSSLPGAHDLKIPTKVEVISDKASDRINTREIIYDVDRIEGSHVVLKRSNIADWQ